MTYQPVATNGKRNVALKLTEDVHIQLTILAQLRATTVPDEIRAAVNEYLKGQRSAMADQAAKVRADIERRAQEQLVQLDSLFGTDTTDNGEAPKSRGGRRSSESAS